jgi:hypothetical protein
VCPQNLYAQVLTPETQNVFLFGNRVLAKGISEDEVFMVGLNPK